MILRPIEIVERAFYRHKSTGQRVSPTGSCPWWSEADKANWELVADGFTLWCEETNGAMIRYAPGPLPTREDAQALFDRLMEGWNAYMERYEAWADENRRRFEAAQAAKKAARKAKRAS